MKKGEILKGEKQVELILWKPGLGPLLVRSLPRTVSCRSDEKTLRKGPSPLVEVGLPLPQFTLVLVRMNVSVMVLFLLNTQEQYWRKLKSEKNEYYQPKNYCCLYISFEL